jgi:hypothetical protein
MGDRAIVIFHNKAKNDYSPQVYLHWAGSSVEDYIKQLEKLMGDRRDDVAYQAARFVGICHDNNPGNISLGIINLPDACNSPDAAFGKLSHGDNGVYLVDCSDYSFKRFK